MYSNRVIIIAFICVEIIFLNNNCKADTTNTNSPNEDKNPSSDASAIFNSQDRDTVIASLIRDRSFADWAKINEEFAKLNNGEPLIPNDYIPHKSGDTIFQDLQFALIKGPQETKLAYLNSLLIHFPNRDYGRIITEILVIEDKNKTVLIDAYNHKFSMSIIDSIKQSQKDDFQNFLLQLAQRTREDMPVYDPFSTLDPFYWDKKDLVDAINKERKEKNWDNHRDQLDNLLMSKPSEMIVGVLDMYAESNHGNTLKDDIPKKIKDENLRFGYNSLIEYAKDPFTYIANCIFDSINDTQSKDLEAALILLVVCHSETDLKQINDTFQKLYQKTIDDLLRGINTNSVRDSLTEFVYNKTSG